MNVIIIITLLLSPLAYSSDDKKISNDTKPEKKLKKELYFLYQDAEKKNGEERTNAIETIKTFYKEHNDFNYNDEYYFRILSEGYNPNHGRHPLSFALRYDLDFASFLIKEKNVKVDDTSNPYLNSTIHYIIPSIIKGGLQEKHKDILTLLINKGSNINGMGIPKRTPLAAYIYGSKIIDPHVLREFFNQGALILAKQETDNIQQRNSSDERYFAEDIAQKDVSCNLLVTSLTQESKSFWYESPSNDTVNRSLEVLPLFIATIFKERIHNLKKSYLNHLYFFAQLNKKIGYLKIPKYLVHTIINMAIQEDKSFVDIKRSIIDKEKVTKRKMVIHRSGIERLDYKTTTPYLTILDRVEHSLISIIMESNSYKDLCWMLSEDFWNRPLETCVQGLDEIIKNNTVQSIEESLTKGP